jgi:hypothetical protein
MKNKLAENMLRFGIKNLNESEVEKLQGLAEQGSGAEFENLGKILNGLVFKNGVYELINDLANVNMFTNKDVAPDSITSESPYFSGAYAAPLYILKNKTAFFFIGRSMTGGPGDGNWTAETRYTIAAPIITEKGFVRNNYRKEVLQTNSAKQAYMQIYNFNTEGYRNNTEITKLVQLLESNGIIPSLQDEIDDTHYKAFLQHRHDSVMRMFKN